MGVISLLSMMNGCFAIDAMLGQQRRQVHTVEGVIAGDAVGTEGAAVWTRGLPPLAVSWAEGCWPASRLLQPSPLLAGSPATGC